MCVPRKPGPSFDFRRSAKKGARVTKTVCLAREAKDGTFNSRNASWMRRKGHKPILPETTGLLGTATHTTPHEPRLHHSEPVTSARSVASFLPKKPQTAADCVALIMRANADGIIPDMCHGRSR